MLSPDVFIQDRAAEAVKALWGADIQPSALGVQVTRKEFEGDYTLVTFPLSRISHSAPENTANAIGAWLVVNVPEVAR